MHRATRALGWKSYDDEHDRVRGEISGRMFDLLTAPLYAKRVPTTDELQARAKSPGIDARPIRVKTYKVS